MRRALTAVTLVVLAAPATPHAFAGGASAPSSTGGTEYGAPLAKPRAANPVATVFRVVPETIDEGARPRITIRIAQRGVKKVRARVVFWPLRGSGGAVARIDLGRVRTGRQFAVTWPKDFALRPGEYTVRVHASGPDGAPLARRARTTGRARLVVRARPVPVAPQIVEGGVFPVAGPHSYGADSSKFGADREDHVHEGQDISADAGTPIVAPVAGTIRSTDVQADGAGWYVVVDGDDGRSFFFAHCQAHTFAVVELQRIAPGQQLCRVGSTGSSSGPHLHFEIWPDGWRISKESRPIDPLPQLLAWDPDY